MLLLRDRDGLCEVVGEMKCGQIKVVVDDIEYETFPDDHMVSFIGPKWKNEDIPNIEAYIQKVTGCTLKDETFIDEHRCAQYQSNTKIDVKRFRSDKHIDFVKLKRSIGPLHEVHLRHGGTGLEYSIGESYVNVYGVFDESDLEYIQLSIENLIALYHK